MAQDHPDRLKLLSIFHYVVGASAALLALALGLLVAPEKFADQPVPGQPTTLAWILLAFVGSLVLFGWAFATLMILGGRFIAQRKYYTACLTIGALACLFFPIGSILGVITLIVLMRPSIRALFEPPGPPVPKTPPPH